MLLQFGLYARVLQGPLRASQAEVAQPALVRWIKLAAAWQVLVLVAAGTYVAVLASRHTPGAAWIAPPVGLVIGTALPLQFVVVAVLRAGRH